MLKVRQRMNTEPVGCELGALTTVVETSRILPQIHRQQPIFRIQAIFMSNPMPTHPTEYLVEMIVRPLVGGTTGEHDLDLGGAELGVIQDCAVGVVGTEDAVVGEVNHPVVVTL